MRIDDHMGIGFTGLASDARVLSNFMRSQALQSKLLFGRPLPVYRIVTQISDKAQANTMGYGSRPYGVGLLVIGYDQNGPHLFEFSPSGNFFEYAAMAIGARSQSAKTYLEKHLDEFASEGVDDLVLHGLRALKDTLQQEKELTAKNVSIGIVGKDSKFYIVDEEKAKAYLATLEAENPGAMDVDA